MDCGRRAADDCRLACREVDLHTMAAGRREQAGKKRGKQHAAGRRGEPARWTDWERTKNRPVKRVLMGDGGHAARWSLAAATQTRGLFSQMVAARCAQMICCGKRFVSVIDEYQHRNCLATPANSRHHFKACWRLQSLCLF